MSENQNEFQNETAEFEKEIIAEAKPSVDTPVSVDGGDTGLPPEPEQIVYTKADEPELFKEDANAPETQLTKEEKQHLEFGKEQLANMFIEAGDGLISEHCSGISMDDDSANWEADETEKENIKTAALNYFGSQNIQVSPLQALLLALGIVYGPRYVLAFKQGRERKKLQSNMQQNRAGITQAFSNPLQKTPKERTSFKIYGTGCYHKDEYGDHKNVDEATARPNFNDPKEVQELIKANGKTKLLSAYPELENILNA